MRKVLKTTAFILADIVAVVCALVLGAILSKSDLGAFFINEWWILLVWVVVSISINAVLKLYAELLRYISFIDMLKVVFASTITCVYCLIVSLICLEFWLPVQFRALT